MRTIALSKIAARRVTALRITALTVTFVVMVVVVVACGGGDFGSTLSADQTAEDTASDAPAANAAANNAALTDEVFSVVVSDPPIADLVARVAGPSVKVTSVVPMGADGHTYEPRPEDARVLAGADAYIENGRDLNPVVTSFALSNYPVGTPHYGLSDVIPEAEMISTESAEEIATHGHAHSFNAHFWPDPIYARGYVLGIERILVSLDRNEADGYQQRAAALVAELDAMHVAFATAIDTIPEANRKLVVYHDSWSYFARRYGMSVVGAIQPTDFSEPSAAELRDTIEEVRAAGVPAFFGSEVFPSDVLGVIEEESGAAYVADLSDDLLPGQAGDPEHGYIGMMVANVRTIVTSLGGDASALDAVDPTLP